MPITPYHFGPAAALALPLRKYLDIPVFVLANVVIDIEPVSVVLLGLNYPLHGYAHTLLVGGILGACWGVIAYKFKGHLKKLMNILRLDYLPSLKTAVLSGVLGAWLHVILDSPLYSDIRPLFPLPFNPLHGLFTHFQVYDFCKWCFLPAIIMYLFIILRKGKKWQNI